MFYDWTFGDRKLASYEQPAVPRQLLNAVGVDTFYNLSHV